MGSSAAVARLLSCASALGLVGCTSPAPPGLSSACIPAAEETRTAIARQLTIHGQGKGARDLAAVMGIISDSIKVFPGDGPVIRGRTQLESTYRDLFTKIRFDSLTYAPQEVRDCGAVLVELGEARGGVTPAGEAPVPIAVRYLHLWERSASAGWLLALAMDQPLTP